MKITVLILLLFSAVLDSLSACRGALSNGSNSSVTDDYFQCDNGECIEIRERCNSETDCFDDSDEENCELCTGFLCNDGQCVSQGDAVECNGVAVCRDNTDEEGCSEELLLIVAIILAVVIVIFVCPVILCVVVWCCLAGALSFSVGNSRKRDHNNITTDVDIELIGNANSCEMIVGPPPTYAMMEYPAQGHNKE